MVNTKKIKMSNYHYFLLLTLIWLGVFLSTCWFPLNNSETVKVLALAFGRVE